MKLLWLTGRNALDSRVLNREEWLAWRFVVGRSQLEHAPHLQIRISTKTALSHIFLHGDRLLVSSDVRDALRGEPMCNAEFIPATLRLDHDHVVYYILNPLEICDCIDYGASDVDTQDGYVTRIRRLVLDTEMAQHSPVFLLANCMAGVVCFSDAVAAKLETLSDGTFAFIEPDEFSSLGA